MAGIQNFLDQGHFLTYRNTYLITFILNASIFEPKRTNVFFFFFFFISTQHLTADSKYQKLCLNFWVQYFAVHFQFSQLKAIIWIA